MENKTPAGIKDKTYFNCFDHLHEAQAAAEVWEDHDIKATIIQDGGTWAVWLDKLQFDTWAKDAPLATVRRLKGQATRAAELAGKEETPQPDHFTDIVDAIIKTAADLQRLTADYEKLAKREPLW